MRLNLSSSPHQRQARNTGQIMRLVAYAMVPGILAQVYWFGIGVLIQLAIAVVFAVASEAAVLAVRGKPIKRVLTDYIAVLTALLIAVCLPAHLPWWMTALAASFAIVVVKQLYGGLGQNLFNPAMIAYVVLLISFPAAMTNWVVPATHTSFDISATFNDIFISNGIDNSLLSDGVTAATPLDSVKTEISQGKTYQESLQNIAMDNTFFGHPYSAWAWINLAYLLGGLLLLKLNVINWHIPVGVLGGVTIFSVMLALIDTGHYASPLFHLLNGGIMLGAFFIATDPVSASTTPKGRIIYGLLIGFWIVIIRTFGNYPDAVAFAVIITNMMVPLIDYYTRPRVYGQRSN